MEFNDFDSVCIRFDSILFVSGSIYVQSIGQWFIMHFVIMLQRCMLFAYCRRNRCRHGRRYHSLFIPLKRPATNIPQQQLSQREHASVSSRMFYAIEINQRQRPLFGFSFHCCCCFHFPLCVCNYRICVIYHKNYAVTIALRCSNVYNHVRISPALLSFLLAISSSIKYAHRSAEWVSR